MTSARKRAQRRTAYLFLFLPAALLGAFAFYPMVGVFILSLRHYNPLTGGDFVGAANYARLFADPNFWWSLLNSVIYLAVTPILIILSLGVAMILRERLKGRDFFRTLYFVPVVTPIVIIGITWRWIFHEDLGLLNYILVESGIVTHKVHWLTSYPLNLLSTMVVTIWRGIGYYMIIFLAGLTMIPTELEEAAILDGASWLKRTIHVTVPLLKPTIVTVFILSSIAAVKVFTEIYVILPGAPSSNKTLVAYMYQTAFEQFDMGYASAIGVLLFLFTLVFSYFNMRLLERGGASWSY